MRAYLTLISSVALLTQCLAFTGGLAVGAQELPAIGILKSHGIKRQKGAAPAWVLAAESPVLKNYRAAKDLENQLAIAQNQQQALEMGNQDPKALIEECRQQIRQLDQRMDWIYQQLKIVGLGNGASRLLVEEQWDLSREKHRLSTLMRDLDDQRAHIREQKWQISGEVVRLRESYMKAVEELRESVPKLVEKYVQLGEDPAIKEALAELSASFRSKQRFGPSADLQKAVKWLAQTEASVQSDSIPLHREAGVDYIDAMLNGKGPVRMVFDTGAGPTMISTKLASDLGLKPTGRTITCEVADGAKVTARLMIIPTITVGRLTIKDVVCAVMPRERGDVPPLLGQTFLRHFDYKYTQGSGRLVLTKVEADRPSVGPVPPEAGSRGEPDRPSSPAGKRKGSRRRGSP
jgi:clan AA aspartic protease (TIGR02281 family)